MLADNDLADAAAEAMVELATISPNGMPETAAQIFRDALPKATGRARLAIVQALGVLKDEAALDALIEAAGDKDENTQVTALWSLRAAAMRRRSIRFSKRPMRPRDECAPQAVKAAFMLAETCAARQQKEDAARVYRYLVQSRTGDEERFVREAANRGLDAMK